MSLNLNKALTAGDVRQILIDTAMDIGADGRDNNFGYGLVDASAAVRRAFALAQIPDLAMLYLANTAMNVFGPAIAGPLNPTPFGPPPSVPTPLSPTDPDGTGGGSSPAPPTTVSMTNGTFSVADPVNSGFGWSTKGNAEVVGGTGVLTEDDRFNSRFSQSFTIPRGATSLSFTILSAAFADDPNGPPDAFEVALIDAHTGQSLVGMAQGLSLTDALLNSLAVGTSRFATTVTVGGSSTSGGVRQFGQPVTVVIDLTGITTDTDATIFFDLLGFGAQGSSVVIDDVQLQGVVELPTLQLTLDPLFDSGTAGDQITRLTVVDLVGTTNPGQEVRVDLDGDGFDDGVIIADQNGAFRVTGVALAAGANSVRVEATNVRGTVTREVIVQLDTQAPTGQWTNAPAGGVTNLQLGYVEIQWTDTGVAGLDLTTIDTSDVMVSGVDIDRAEHLGAGLVRYWYSDDGETLTNGMVEVTRVSSAVSDRAGNTSIAHTDTFLLDTLAPTSDIFDVTPDLRNVPVGNVRITFSEPVTGVDLADFTLTRDGSPVSLGGATLLEDGASSYLLDLSGVTALAGSYVLRLAAANSEIRDSAGNDLAGNAEDSWVIDTTPPIGQMIAPVVNSTIDLDPGYVEIQWTDSGPAGLDPASIDVNDVSLPGVDVDRVENLGGGLVRYWYNDDGDSLPDGTIEVTLRAGEIRDLAGNSNPAGSAAFVLQRSTGQPLMIVEIRVNDGSAQRSSIETISVRFNQATNMQTLIDNQTVTTAVQLFGLTLLPLAASRYRYDALTNTLVIDLTTDGFGDVRWTMLADGRYKLRLDTRMILSAQAVRLVDDDATNDMFRDFGFHRLEADFDGDADVDLLDRDLLFQHYATSVSDPRYNPAFDLTLDGRIDNSDYLRWKKRYGRRV